MTTPADAHAPDGYVWRSAGGYAARCLARGFVDEIDHRGNAHRRERARYAAHAGTVPLGDAFPSLVAAMEACARHLQRHSGHGVAA